LSVYSKAILCGLLKPGAPAINQILKAVGWMYKVRFKGECLVLLFSEPKYMVPWLIHWSP
jgi:hypothetical protein